MRVVLAAAVWCVLAPLAWSGSLAPGETKVLSFKKSLPPVGESLQPAICESGRWVVFLSDRTNLTDPAGNGLNQVILHDRKKDDYRLVSVSTLGAQAASDCYLPTISKNGRYVVFYTVASNLVAGDTLGHHDVFRHDRKTGETVRASLTWDEKEPNAGCTYPRVSGNGYCVTFQSTATNLVAAGGNGFSQIYVRDLLLGNTERVSVGPGGVAGNDDSQRPSLSHDGGIVAFHSEAGNIGGPVGTHVYVRNRQTGQTELISRGHGGELPQSGSRYALVSANGRFVAFTSTASNLTAEDKGPATEDVFVFDRKKEKMEQWVLKAGGKKLDGSVQGISANGRYVLAASQEILTAAGKLANSLNRMHLIDREQGTAELCSVNCQGKQANGTCPRGALCASGKYMVFDSIATNLGKDEDILFDVFIHRE